MSTHSLSDSAPMDPVEKNAVTSASDMARTVEEFRGFGEHAHVNTVSAEHLMDALRTALNPETAPQNDSLNATSLDATLKTTIAKKLNDRATQRRKQFMQADGKYKVTIIDGKPEEEVKKLAASRNTDIIVFGRHATFHRRPFLIGRVPLHTMLSQQHCVLVAPRN